MHEWFDQMNAIAIEDQEYEDLKRQVLIHVGVSLARYQKIEKGLKALLPFLAREDSYSSDNPFAEMHELLESKTTLGPLIQRLKEFSTADEPDNWTLYLETVIHQRNELVHQFFQLPIGKLHNETACQEAIEHLKSRLEYVQPLLDVINAMLESMIQSFEATIESPIH